MRGQRLNFNKTKQQPQVYDEKKAQPNRVHNKRKWNESDGKERLMDIVDPGMKTSGWREWTDSHAEVKKDRKLNWIDREGMMESWEVVRVVMSAEKTRGMTKLTEPK